MSRLRLGFEIDDASRGRQVRDIVQTVARQASVKGALIVAPDGFVIAAEVPESIAVEPLAALAATLGRDLEVGASRLGRRAFQTALFSADDGTLFLATSPIGLVVALAEPQASLPAVGAALAEAVRLIEAAWATDVPPPSA
jgi:predicted regulator of Ras-like GTPase activity (Roadblock/LC7/MglB family)